MTNLRPSVVYQSDGITLVEVLVTLMIIGILASVVILNFGSTQRASVQNACRTNADAAQLGVSTFRSDNNGALPASLAALVPTYISAGLITTDAFTLSLAVESSQPVIKVTPKGASVPSGNAPTACGSL